MDKQERDRLRALCEATPEPPWAVHGPWRHGLMEGITLVEDFDDEMLAEITNGHGPPFSDELRERYVRVFRFLCESRTALPAALDALDAMEAKCAGHLANANHAYDQCIEVSEQFSNLRAKLDAAEAERRTTLYVLGYDKEDSRPLDSLASEALAQKDNHLVDIQAKLDAAEAAIADAAKPFLAESDLIEFYKARMVEHRTNAIASRKRAEKAEAEMVAKAEDLADSITKAVDESADRRISELEAQLATIRRTTIEHIVRRMREVGGATAHPESCVGYYRAANIIEREFLNEKGE